MHGHAQRLGQSVDGAGKRLVDLPLVDQVKRTFPEAELVALLRYGPDDLPGDWRVEFEERAAIMEFDGNLPRERAEALALTDVLRRMWEKDVKPRSTNPDC